MKLNLVLFCSFVLSSTAIFSQNDLPTESSVIFSGSGNCLPCHSSNGYTMNWNNIDVSPISYWRSTIMGNASKDPLWRAMVAGEVNAFPLLQSNIETTCLKCHSPMGFTQAIYNGQSGYSMDELKQDPLANDGVSCTVCHQIKPDNFGSHQSYSGNYLIKPDGVLYGPYEDSNLMVSAIGYEGKYAPHVNQSELCATCHTLFTKTYDSSGNPVGQFAEQTAYIEWKNSNFSTQNIQCQDCHMPKIYDPIVISSWGSYPPRTPFWRHNFVGGNVYMLNILKNNIDSVGATAEPQHFDSTIERTKNNLTEKSIEFNVSSGFINNQLEIKVFIKNLTGHKIPTGIPFRRMWIHLRVEEIDGGVIFESGEWDNTGKIPDYSSPYEEHFDSITSDNEVQVYEGVFVNDEQQVSYTLLRAAKFIKDNRIPPAGFTTTHASYDTVRIYGSAADDINFNKSGNDEGTGSDSIKYFISASPNTSYRIIAEVCYQSVKPELVDHLREINIHDINRFVNMYDKLPNFPFIMKNITYDIITGVEDGNLVNNYLLKQNYPNPFNPSTVISYQLPIRSQVILKVYDVLGHEVATLVNEEKPAGTYEVSWNEEGLSSGVYFYQLQAGSFLSTRKMLLLK